MQKRCGSARQGYLHGQLVPSEVRAMVLPSGQQPKGVLSQDERASPVGGVVAATVGPAKRHDVFIRNRTLNSTLASFPLLRNCSPRSPIKTDLSESNLLKPLFKGHFERVKMHHCGTAPGYLCRVSAGLSKIWFDGMIRIWRIWSGKSAEVDAVAYRARYWNSDGVVSTISASNHLRWLDGQ